MRVKLTALAVAVALAAACLGCGGGREETNTLTRRPPKANALEGRSVLIVLAGDGFRDEEAYLTRDTLTAAGAAVRFCAPRVEPVHAAIMGSIMPDLALTDVSVEDYDAIVFVGWLGGPGLDGNEAARSLASSAASAGKVVAGIDHGITVLERTGLVQPLASADDEGEPSEVHGASESEIGQPEGGVVASGGARRAIPATPEQLAEEDFVPQTVVRDGRIVTAVGPRDATRFAHEIVSAIRDLAAEG